LSRRFFRNFSRFSSQISFLFFVIAKMVFIRDLFVFREHREKILTMPTLIGGAGGGGRTRGPGGGF
jgi:hypothetical protein